MAPLWHRVGTTASPFGTTMAPRRFCRLGVASFVVHTSVRRQERAMQYLVSVIDDKSGSATEDEMTAINAFNADVQAAGHWVFAGGLNAPSTATVIDNRGAETLFTDGPFLE